MLAALTLVVPAVRCRSLLKGIWTARTDAHNCQARSSRAYDAYDLAQSAARNASAFVPVCIINDNRWVGARVSPRDR